MCEEIFFGAVVKMHININFMQQTTAVYENTYGQLLYEWMYSST